MAALLVAFAPVPSRDAHAAQTVTIGTAGVMGMYYPLGGAVCRMVNVTRKQHRLRCSVESSEGSVANIRGVLGGQFDMGIAQGDTQLQAREGQGAFDGKPQPKLRGLFNVYPETLALVAREDANIRSLRDLKGKRVSIGTPGSGTRFTMELVLAAAGLRKEDLGAVVDTKIVELPPALCDNKVDAFAFMAGHPNPILQDASTGCRTRFVPITGPGIDALVVTHPYFARTEVPAGVYKGVATPQPTIGTMASIVVSADMPDDVAYAITKAVFENFDDFRKLHAALSPLTRETAARRQAVPTHPGAERYFREAGYW